MKKESSRFLKSGGTSIIQATGHQPKCHPTPFRKTVRDPSYSGLPLSSVEELAGVASAEVHLPDSVQIPEDIP